MKKISLVFMVILLICCSGCGEKSGNMIIPEQPFLMESIYAE